MARCVGPALRGRGLPGRGCVWAKGLPSLGSLVLPWDWWEGRLSAPSAPLHLCLTLQEEAVGPWYHPSAQEIQPLFGEHRLEGDGRGWVKTHCCLEDAWNGGSSLLIRGLIPPEVGTVAVR